MIDFRIKAVLNPKEKKSSEGEAIYLCIERSGTTSIFNLKKFLKKTKVVFWKISKFVKGQKTNVEGEDEEVYGRKFTPFRHNTYWFYNIISSYSVLIQRLVPIEKGCFVS